MDIMKGFENEQHLSQIRPSAYTLIANLLIFAFFLTYGKVTFAS